MHSIHQMLLKQIEHKIQIRELRISLNAKNIISLEDIELPAPDYGFGVIPKLPIFFQINEIALEAIDGCSCSIEKLHILSDFIGFVDDAVILSLLCEDHFDDYDITALSDKLCLISASNKKQAAVSLS